MAGKKSALGRGLGALIPEIDEENTTEGKYINEIEINKIFPNEDQPRKNFDDEKLAQLTASIKEHGVIQPIIVKREGEFYKIIAGERRWRAAKLAGLKKVPVIEKKLSELETMELSLIENLQRENLNPIEEALAYKQLIDEYKLTQDEIAEKLGKSRPSITNSMRLLNLDERVQTYIAEGTMSEGHGKVLLGLTDKEQQYEVSKKIIDENLSIRQTEELIKSLIKNRKKTPAKKVSKDIYIKDIEEKLKSVLGTKVYITKGKNRNKIEIEYYSEDDLQRILNIFKLW